MRWLAWIQDTTAPAHILCAIHSILIRRYVPSSELQHPESAPRRMFDKRRQKRGESGLESQRPHGNPNGTQTELVATSTFSPSAHYRHSLPAIHPTTPLSPVTHQSLFPAQSPTNQRLQHTEQNRNGLVGSPHSLPLRTQNTQNTQDGNGTKHIQNYKTRTRTRKPPLAIIHKLLACQTGQTGQTEQTQR